jgi:hypothetical protein
MKPRLYIETTIPSYLVARTSRELIIAGHQQSTRYWWTKDRSRFDCYISRLVLDEAAAGDPDAAGERLQVLAGIPELPATEHALNLATALVAEGAIPEKARTDAAHIAIAAVHHMDFIVTWNFRHIANAEKEPHIRKVCHIHGWPCPVICSPEQLMVTEGEET